MAFRKLDLDHFSLNPFSSIGKEWMLLSAGSEENWNTMTVSWGSLGVLWGKNAATCYVRPQRYTHEFMEKEDSFTLSLLKDGHRDALALCGKMSGREGDKAAAAGLTPVFIEGHPTFEEAKLVIVCKKMAKGKFEPELMIDSGILDQYYSMNDYHEIYYGEILGIYTKD